MVWYGYFEFRHWKWVESQKHSFCNYNMNIKTKFSVKSTVNGCRYSTTVEILDMFIPYLQGMGRYAESVGTWALVPRQFWSEQFWHALFLGKFSLII